MAFCVGLKGDGFAFASCSGSKDCRCAANVDATFASVSTSLASSTDLPSQFGQGGFDKVAFVPTVILVWCCCVTVPRNTVTHRLLVRFTEDTSSSKMNKYEKPEELAKLGEPDPEFTEVCSYSMSV